ncbi:autotransporter outer membrane beta-barrel domain-containing protein [Paraburkholderia youngii]|uniref:autotransporter outer membrane beta-barrel domain-containing protein n=1 Tax=Paraburkholderia youngii TaxID=2782701 RepID=UPI003D20CB8A
MSIALLTAISAMAATPVFASACDVTTSGAGFSLAAGDCKVESGVTVSGATGSAAVSVSGAAGTLTNLGSVLGGAYGVQLVGGSFDTLANEADALISGDTAGVAVGPGSTLSTLTNSGTITNNGGIGGGVINNGTIGLLLNNAGATIGGFNAVNNTGVIAEVENNGTIGDAASGQNGFDNSGSITTFNNTGAILINTPLTGALANLGGTIGALTNSGQISGVQNQGAIGSINNAASGNITSVYGIGNFGTGQIGTLSNSGTVASSGTMLQPGAAINNTGSIASIDNSGSLIGGEYGEGIWNNGGSIGSVHNGSAGTITGGLYALENSQTIGSVTNDGLIAANAGAGVQALYNLLGATVTSLTNTGTISATGTLYPTAVGNGGFIGTLDNSGVLSTSGATDATTYGVSNNGTIGTLTNSGTISGSLAGAGVFSGPGSTIGTFTNTGKVAAVINYGSIGSLDNQAGGTLTTGSIAQSAVQNAGTIATLKNEGAIGNADGSSTTGVSNSGLVTALDNAGAITGNTAVSNTHTIVSLTNEATGTLAGANAGISNAFISNIGTLSNLGQITTTGVSAAGVSNSGTIGTLTNSGSIESVAAGPSATGIANHGSITTLINSGTIGASGSGAGLENDGTIGSVDNRGQLTGVQNIFGQATNTYIGSLTNEASGVILGTGVAGGAAVSNKSGTIATLANDGQIGSAIGTSSTIGVSNVGLINALSNIGTIAGLSNGLVNSGTIGSINNSGLVAAGSVGVLPMALENTGLIGSLQNSGRIAGQTAIENFSTITSFANNAGGTIAGDTAVLNIGFVGSISNSGDIAGAYQGIENLGSIGSIDNAGSISSVVNSGTIGAGGTAIVNEVNGSLGVLNNSGLISGDVKNLSSNVLTITGGTSTFGTFSGAAGAIGSIVSQSADVALASGSVLLNDNVNLGGAHSLNNTGATLQVNSQLTINGNYSQSANAHLLFGVADSAVAAGDAGDAGYGRLVVSGDATIAAGSSVGLQKLASYAFAPGQRFVVVDAGANSNYNEGMLRYSATGFAGSILGQDVVNNGRHDLVLSLSAGGSGAGGSTGGTGGTGTGTGGTGSSGTGSTGTGSDTGSGDTGSTSTGSGGTGQGTTGTDTVTGGGDVGGGGITLPMPTTPTNPQAAAALGGLMHYTGSDNAALLNLYNAVDSLAYFGSSDQVNRAGQQLSPLSQAASASHAAAAPTLDVLNIVGSRTNSLRLADVGIGSGVATGDGTSRVGVWGQAFGGHASQNAEDQVDGYSANYAGVLVGVDKAVAPNWVAGGVFAYSNTAVSNTGATAGDTTRVNSYGFTGYASYSGNPWYVNLSAGITPQHFDTTRVISLPGFAGVANGSFSGQQYVAHAEFGFPLTLACATFTPEASLTYSYSHQSAYTETGGNGAALSVDAMHDTSVRSSLGAKIVRGFSTSHGELIPELSARWIHEFDHSRLISGASYAADPTGQTAFTTVGASPISDYADLGLGVTLLRASNLSLTARYEMQAGKGFLSQTGSLKLRQLF